MSSSIHNYMKMMQKQSEGEPESKPEPYKKPIDFLRSEIIIKADKHDKLLNEILDNRY